MKRSKPRPGAVARPGNTGERLSAPQPYFLASCWIAAVLHFASFLNALGFDFDISDPPSVSFKTRREKLKKKNRKMSPNQGERRRERGKKKKKRGGEERKGRGVKRSTD